MGFLKRFFGKNEPETHPEPVEPQSPPPSPMITIREISPAELPQFLAANNTAQVVDTRMAWEYASGHIPGAISLPINELSFRMDEVPRDVPLVIQCYHGHNSLDVAAYLIQQGWDAENTVSLSGGISGWMMTHGIDALEKES